MTSEVWVGACLAALLIGWVLGMISMYKSVVGDVGYAQRLLRWAEIKAEHKTEVRRYRAAMSEVGKEGRSDGSTED